MARSKTTTRRGRTAAPEATAAEAEATGLGFEDSLIVTTTVLLLGAVVLAFFALRHYPG